MDAVLVMWLLLMLAGFIGSAIYSGMETGAYSLNRVRLQVRHHQKDAAAASLYDMTGKPVILLSTLLIGNNVANYIGTAGMTVLLEAAAFGEWQIIALNVLIVTPMLFVFGETLPKDLFAAHADALMYRLTPVLTWSRRVFEWTGLLLVVVSFSRVMNRLLRGSGEMTTLHPRRQMTTLVKEGVAEGLLSDEQSAMVERVLAMADRRLEDEMTPWARVGRVRKTDSIEQLRKRAVESGHTRFPVEDAGGKVVGIVNIFEVLLSEDPSPSIELFMVEPLRLDATTPLRLALRRLQAGDRHIAVVTRGNRPVGIVTIKDLVEPITGELIDW